MKAALTSSLLSDSAKSAQPAALSKRMVVAYHDELCRALTQPLCHGLIQSFAEDLGVEQTWCEFSSLAQPKTYYGILPAAAQADAVVVAIRIDRPWPPILGFWMEAWVTLRTKNRGALVALMVTKDPFNNLTLAARLRELTQYFRGVATRANMEYFEQEYCYDSQLCEPFSGAQVTRQWITER